jgi:hypothetical protein
MRATVGPLPAAVYWRRRAVVLGALLLGVIVLFVSCSGGDDDSKRGTGVSSQAPSPAPAASTPDDEPSFTDPGPGAGNPSLPEPGDVTGSGTSAGTDDGTDDGTQDGTADTNVTAPDAGACTDAEISVTPVPAATTIRRGATLAIRLKIKNISARTCSRDVGADLQELYINEGADKIWSSDTCSALKGSEVRSLPPNDEREYNVTWNGKQSNKCSAGLAAGTAPPAGQYEVRGRLGAKVSAPVALDITN